MRAEEILKRRRDRAIAIILSVKEREVDPLLSQMPGGTRASQLLRKVVLDQINDLYALALDIANSGEVETFEFNPEVWLPRIEGQLDALRRDLAALGNGQH
jgi:hypothetical protein